jgi:hypothetical protein
VGVGETTVVMSKPEPLLLAVLDSSKDWPGEMTLLAFTVNVCSLTVLQTTFQLRVTSTDILRGRLRFKTVAVRLFGEVQPEGRTSVNVVSTRTPDTGPLL